MAEKYFVGKNKTKLHFSVNRKKLNEQPTFLIKHPNEKGLYLSVAKEIVFYNGVGIIT